MFSHPGLKFTATAKHNELDDAQKKRTSWSLAGGPGLEEEDASVSPTLSGSAGVGGGFAVGIARSALSSCEGGTRNSGYHIRVHTTRKKSANILRVNKGLREIGVFGVP